jgi:hypothetical protein
MIQNPTGSAAWPKPVLRRLVLLYSRCHPGELQRALAAHTDGEGHLVVPDASSPVRGYYLAAVMQAAIERVFDSQRVQQRLRLNPQFGQMVLDAFYYPVFCWTEDTGSAETLDATEDALREHLLRRFQRSVPPRRQQSELEGIALSDLRYLHGLLLELLALLQSPVDLVHELASDKSGQEDQLFWQTALRRFSHGALALVEKMPVEKSKYKYRWRFNQYGEPLTPYARLEAAAEPFDAAGEPLELATSQMAEWASALVATLANVTGATLGLEQFVESVTGPVASDRVASLRATLDSVSGGFPDEAAEVFKVWIRRVLDNSDCLRVALMGAGLLAQEATAKRDFAAGLEKVLEKSAFSHAFQESNPEKKKGLISDADRELKRLIEPWRVKHAALGAAFEEAVRSPEKRPEIWLQKLKYLLDGLDAAV